MPPRKTLAEETPSTSSPLPAATPEGGDSPEQPNVENAPEILEAVRTPVRWGIRHPAGPTFVDRYSHLSFEAGIAYTEVPALVEYARSQGWTTWDAAGDAPPAPAPVAQKVYTADDFSAADLVKLFRDHGLAPGGTKDQMFERLVDLGVIARRAA